MKIASIVLASVISAGMITSTFAANPPAVACPSSADIRGAQYQGPIQIGTYSIPGTGVFLLSDGSQVFLELPDSDKNPTPATVQAYLNETTTSWTPNAVDGSICSYKPGDNLDGGQQPPLPDGFIAWINTGNSPQSANIKAKLYNLMNAERNKK